jgi:hypothetical protein
LGMALVVGQLVVLDGGAVLVFAFCGSQIHAYPYSVYYSDKACIKLEFVCLPFLRSAGGTRCCKLLNLFNAVSELRRFWSSFMFTDRKPKPAKYEPTR